MNNKGSDDMECDMCGEVSKSSNGVLFLSLSYCYNLTPFCKSMETCWNSCWSSENLKCWKTILSCSWKIPTIYHRLIIKIIWECQVIACWPMHMTMISYFFKSTWGKSYGSSKMRFETKIGWNTKTENWLVLENRSKSP